MYDVNLITTNMPTYDPLKDNFLADYFRSPIIQKHLKKQGLVTKLPIHLDCLQVNDEGVKVNERSLRALLLRERLNEKQIREKHDADLKYINFDIERAIREEIKLQNGILRPHHESNVRETRTSTGIRLPITMHDTFETYTKSVVSEKEKRGATKISSPTAADKDKSSRAPSSLIAQARPNRSQKLRIEFQSKQNEAGNLKNATIPSISNNNVEIAARPNRAQLLREQIMADNCIIQSTTSLDSPKKSRPATASNKSSSVALDQSHHLLSSSHDDTATPKRPSSAAYRHCPEKLVRRMASSTTTPSHSLSSLLVKSKQTGSNQSFGPNNSALSSSTSRLEAKKANLPASDNLKFGQAVRLNTQPHAFPKSSPLHSSTKNTNKAVDGLSLKNLRLESHGSTSRPILSASSKNNADKSSNPILPLEAGTRVDGENGSVQDDIAISTAHATSHSRLQSASNSSIDEAIVDSFPAEKTQQRDGSELIASDYALNGMVEEGESIQVSVANIGANFADVVELGVQTEDYSEIPPVKESLQFELNPKNEDGTSEGQHRNSTLRNPQSSIGDLVKFSQTRTSLDSSVSMQSMLIKTVDSNNRLIEHIEPKINIHPSSAAFLSTTTNEPIQPPLSSKPVKSLASKVTRSLRKLKVSFSADKHASSQSLIVDPVTAAIDSDSSPSTNDLKRKTTQSMAFIHTDSQTNHPQKRVSFNDSSVQIA